MILVQLFCFFLLSLSSSLSSSSCFNENPCLVLDTAREERARNGNVGVQILLWTRAMLDLVHRSSVRCVDHADQCNDPSSASEEELIPSEYFIHSFADQICSRQDGSVPCLPRRLIELERSQQERQFSDSFNRRCHQEPWSLHYDCEIRQSISDLVNEERMLGADVIVFEGTNNRVWGRSMLPQPSSPRCPRQLWAMHEFRPASVYPFLRDKEYLNQFNFTIGYSKNWTLWTADFFPGKDYFTKRVEHHSLSSSLAPVVMFISQCDTPSKRLKYIEKLMEHISIDSYGKCLHNKDIAEESQSSNRYKEKETIISSYPFTLCFENSLEPDYVSEKVHNALAVGSVPVYRGASNIEDFVPSNSIINADHFDSPAELAAHLLWLLENEQEYEKLLLWKSKPPEEHMTHMAQMSRRDYICQICDFVHEAR